MNFGRLKWILGGENEVFGRVKWISERENEFWEEKIFCMGKYFVYN